MRSQLCYLLGAVHPNPRGHSWQSSTTDYASGGDGLKGGNGLSDHGVPGRAIGAWRCRY
jgi:hypothetical protein